MKDILIKFRIQLGLFFLLLIIFMPVLLSGRVLYWGTISLQFIPWMKAGIESMITGQIPLWNPWNGFGAPLLANYQTAFFYPLNWFLVAFYKIWGIAGLQHGYTWLYVFHLIIAATGMSMVLKESGRSEKAQFLGGFLWVFGGYIISRISFISMVWSFAWIAWMVYAVLQIRNSNNAYTTRSFLLLSAFTFMQMMSGHAQTGFMTFLILGFITVYPLKETLKKAIQDIRHIALAILLGTGLAAVQLLPTFEYLSQSQRSSEIGYEYAVNFSFWPLRIFSILFGGFWGNPGIDRFFGGGTFWEDQIYHGVIPIVLVLVLLIGLVRKSRSTIQNKDRKFLLILGVVGLFGLLLAAGKNLPLFPWLYDTVSFFRLFQAPSRFLLLFTFALVIVTSFAFDYWYSKAFNIRKVGLLVAVSMSMLLSVFLIRVVDIEIPIEMRESILWSASLLLLFGILTIFKTQFPNKGWMIGGLVVALAILDLIVINFPYGHFAQPLSNDLDYRLKQINSTKNLTYIRQPVEEFLKFDRYYRFDRFQPLENDDYFYPLMVPNSNLFMTEFSFVNNFDPFVPRNYERFRAWLESLSPDQQILALEEFGVSQIADLDIGHPEGVQITQLEPENIVQWYQCAIGMPEDEILDAILYNGSKNETRLCIFLSEEFTYEMTPEDMEDSQSGMVTKIDREGSNLTLHYSSSREGWLVIRQTWYPGWVATLEDGEKIDIEKVDLLFQGLRVPAGDNLVTLTYQPLSFRTGLILSCLSLIIFLWKLTPFILPVRRKHIFEERL